MKKKNLMENLILFIPLLILIFISILNMYKIGSIMNIYKNYYIKQIIWFLLGFIVMTIIMIVKPKLLFKYSRCLFWSNVLLLVLVLFFGKTINGSRAWFNLGFFSFQPSELMKFTLAIYLSNIIDRKGQKNNDLKLILKVLFVTLIPSLFVFLEPDTGAIIIYFIIMLGILIVNKINKKWYITFFLITGGFLGILGYLYYFNQDMLIKLLGTSLFYRIDRILTFVNKDSFQLNRALIAIGNAKIIGANNYIYIPEAPTDFIVALSINNLGIISFLLILLCFFILDIYFLFKLFKLNNLKAKMFYAGFLMMFIFAQIQNIGMNLGLLPIIGLPLPFLSYGGTNIIVYFMFLGVLFSLKNKA